jgi:hypothetical protein
MHSTKQNVQPKIDEGSVPSREEFFKQNGVPSNKEETAGEDSRSPAIPINSSFPMRTGRRVETSDEERARMQAYPQNPIPDRSRDDPDYGPTR